MTIGPCYFLLQRRDRPLPVMICPLPSSCARRRVFAATMGHDAMLGQGGKNGGTGA